MNEHLMPVGAEALHPARSGAADRAGGAAPATAPHDDAFPRRGGAWHCEDVALADLADEFDTPLYVYSAGALRARFRRFDRAFAAVPHTVCYSVKCCSNLHILRLLAGEGAGFDVVSGGELARVLKAGGDPAQTVFAGVGKTAEELRQALAAGIGMFNVESEGELEALAVLAAERGVRAPVALRLNPDVDPRTHRYITTGKAENKFGLDREAVMRVAARARALPAVELRGLHLHIGSQIRDAAPYRAALAVAAETAAALRAQGAPLESLNVGGGFGIDYRQGSAPLALEEFGAALVPALAALGLHVLFEPGRSIAGPAGVLLTRVQYVKRSGPKTFVICDAGMHTLLRPTLYQAYHPIWPVQGPGPDEQPATIPTDVVGPICETGDAFAADRPLPAVAPGALLAVFCAGAYGMAMASQYNSHPLPAEVLVEGARRRCIRRRQSCEALWAEELS